PLLSVVVDVNAGVGEAACRAEGQWTAVEVVSGARADREVVAIGLGRRGSIWSGAADIVVVPAEGGDPVYVEPGQDVVVAIQRTPVAAYLSIASRKIQRSILSHIPECEPEDQWVEESIVGANRQPGGIEIQPRLVTRRVRVAEVALAVCKDAEPAQEARRVG